MTIIFSNREDRDCICLKKVFEGLDAKVVEITPHMRNWENKVDDALFDEDETLVIIGHGTGYGLLAPSFGEYVVHDNNVGLIHAENVICIWCFASEFCKRNGLHAFASNMFISNTSEAYMMLGYVNHTPDEIDENSKRFYGQVNGFLKERKPIDEWKKILEESTDKDNSIDVFNRQALYYD